MEFFSPFNMAYADKYMLTNCRHVGKQTDRQMMDGQIEDR